jgi:hypothetical protein
MKKLIFVGFFLIILFISIAGCTWPSQQTVTTECNMACNAHSWKLPPGCTCTPTLTPAPVDFIPSIAEKYYSRTLVNDIISDSLNMSIYT